MGFSSARLTHSPGCWLPALDGTWFLSRSSSSVAAAPELFPQISQPRSHTPASVWALTLEKGDGVCSSHLILERFRLVAPQGIRVERGREHPEPSSCGPVGGSSKAAGNKGSNEGVWLHCICSRVLQRGPGCWSLLQLLKHFTWKSYWITRRSRNNSWSWDQNSWEGDRARILQKTAAGRA